jgi:hypothetical protein
MTSPSSSAGSPSSSAGHSDRSKLDWTLAARFGVVPFFSAAGLLGALLLRSFPGLPQIAFSLFLFAAYVAVYRMMFAGRSILDVGTLFMFTVLTYQVFPLISLELSDYNLGIFADNRLNSIALTTSFLSEIWRIQTLIMTGFGSLYLLFKRAPAPTAPNVGENQRWFFATMLAVALAIIVVANVFLGAETYLDEYVAMQDLPLIAIQILNIVNQMFFAAMFGYLIISIRDRPWIAIVTALLACAILALTTGARTPIAIIVFGLFIAYDAYRVRINPVFLASFAVFLIGTFLVGGLLRGGGVIGDLLGQNEFMSVFVTTLDLYQIAITGSARDMATELWVADLLRPIPGQLLPFEKFDAAIWYMTNFYPLQAAAGHGYGFSMASEAVLGGGTFAALARSGLLGLFVALIVGRLERSSSIYAKIGAVWLFCFIYLAYRDTTFTLVPRFLFQFGPALAVIYVIERFFVPLPPERQVSVERGEKTPQPESSATRGG